MSFKDYLMAKEGGGLDMANNGLGPNNDQNPATIQNPQNTPQSHDAYGMPIGSNPVNPVDRSNTPSGGGMPGPVDNIPRDSRAMANLMPDRGHINTMLNKGSKPSYDYRSMNNMFRDNDAARAANHKNRVFDPPSFRNKVTASFSFKDYLMAKEADDAWGEDPTHHSEFNNSVDNLLDEDGFDELKSRYNIDLKDYDVDHSRRISPEEYIKLYKDLAGLASTTKDLDFIRNLSDTFKDNQGQVTHLSDFIPSRAATGGGLLGALGGFIAGNKGNKKPEPQGPRDYDKLSSLGFKRYLEMKK